MKKLSIALLLVAIAIPAFSHLAQLTKQNGATNLGRDRWPLGSPISWNLNPSTTGTNLNIGASSPTDVMVNSFGAWNGAPGAALAIQRGADSAKTAPAFDCVNLIAFKCTSNCDFDDSTLGITFTTTSDRTSDSVCQGGTQFLGQILDADILFNQNVEFTTGGGAGQDLRTVATHEIGHFLGLDHSGVVKSMMFPFAPDLLTTLSYDDVAGVVALYPASGTVSSDICASTMGVISGNVNFVGSSGVFGAHVTAHSTTDAIYAPWTNIRKSPISGVSRPDGSYCITGLPPDSYLVAAEPLDDPVTDGDIGNYSTNYGRTSVQTNFVTRWH